MDVGWKARLAVLSAEMDVHDAERARILAEIARLPTSSQAPGEVARLRTEVESLDAAAVWMAEELAALRAALED